MRTRRIDLSVFLMMLVLGVLCVTSVQARIIRLKSNGDESNDGSTWTLAKRTVASAMSAAVSGDEIWVAKGTYYEQGGTTLKNGVAMYGGFRGVEASLAERPPFPRPVPDVNASILDGNNASTVITVQSGSTSSTRIDGFTLRNSNGAGVVCIGGACPTISNNVITQNKAGVQCGTDVFDNAAAPTLLNNLITLNEGPGVYVDQWSSGVIANNRIAHNLGSGVASRGYSRITNNTIVANNGANVYGGGGIVSDGSYAETSNNIVAFNLGCGISASGSGVVLKNNDSYGQSYQNYVGLNPVPGNISLDPKLVAFDYGRLHIQPDSPCINAGYDAAVVEGWVDMDGQVRKQDAHVDIGADESDGTTWSGEPAVVRVSPSGNDSNDGSTWPLAKRTIRAGVDVASEQGGEVWVAAGNYHERVTVRPFAYLYGGFTGGESSKTLRNWTANPTVIDGGAAGSVVTLPACSLALVGIDGFVIRNGSAACGGGVYAVRHFMSHPHKPAVVNCRITSNTADQGGGVYCSDLSYVSMSGNMVDRNTATTGGGVCCGIGYATITNNTIVSNTATAGGGISGVHARSTLVNNIVAFNSSGVWGTEPWFSRVNDVYANAAYNYSGLPPGIGDISLDPQFLAPWVGEYHLRPTSPCINAGYNAYVTAGATDLDGKPRILPVGGTVDMGCFEYDSTPYWVREIGQARGIPEQFAFQLQSKPVSAVFGDAFYLEERDRIGGIRVLSDEPVQPGDLMTLTGHTAMDNGERAIQVDSISVTAGSPANVPAPVFARTNWLGGGPFFWNMNGEACGQGGITNASGLNNIGLLIRTWGRFTKTGDATFAIDDGSGVIVKCIAPDGVTLDSAWTYVSVTGVSSCEKVGGELRRLVRATSVTPM